MKLLLCVAGSGLLLWSLGSNDAHADVERHDLKLTLDASMLGWAQQTVRYPDGGKASVEIERAATSIGFLGAGNLALGFAATRWLIPTLSFGLQQAKLKSNDEGFTTTYRQWELRPSLEVALLPGLRLVPFVNAGLSVVGRVTKDEEDDRWKEETKAFGYGPVLGIGLHGFVVEQASLDLSFSYRALFFGETDASNTVLPQDVPLKQREHALLLNLGASFWI